MTSKIERALAAGTPAKMLYDPSCDQVLAAVCCTPFVAEDDGKRSCGAVLTGFATVTPTTNLTVLSMWYQAYLNIIFHRSNIAFYTHATTMPLVNLFWLAWAASFKIWDVTEYPDTGPWLDLSFFLCCAFFVWYLIWGISSGLWWFGFTSLPILAVCYIGAHYYYEYQYYNLHPMWLSALAAFIQSLSHWPEDLPPRVGGIQAWSKKRDFFFREVDSCCDMIGRLIRVGMTALIWGPFDEWVASPRLMPLFWSLWPMHKFMTWCDCGGESKRKIDDCFAKAQEALEPQYRVEVTLDPKTGAVVTKALPNQLDCCWGMSDKCAGILCCDEVLHDKEGREMIANPALDFLGVGGSSYMTVADKVKWTDVICCNYDVKTDVGVDVMAGIRQACRVVSEDSFVVGVSAHPPQTVNEEMGETGAAAKKSSSSAASKTITPHVEGLMKDEGGHRPLADIQAAEEKAKKPSTSPASAGEDNKKAKTATPSGEKTETQPPSATAATQ